MEGLLLKKSLIKTICNLKGSSSSHIHSTSTREATGNYVQHYPFTHSSARSYPGFESELNLKCDSMSIHLMIFRITDV